MSAINTVIFHSVTLFQGLCKMNSPETTWWRSNSLCCLKLKWQEYGFIMRWRSEENHYKSVSVRDSEKPRDSSAVNGEYKEMHLTLAAAEVLCQSEGERNKWTNLAHKHLWRAICTWLIGCAVSWCLKCAECFSASKWRPEVESQLKWLGLNPVPMGTQVLGKYSALSQPVLTVWPKAHLVNHDPKTITETMDPGDSRQRYRGECNLLSLWALWCEQLAEKEEKLNSWAWLHWYRRVQPSIILNSVAGLTS